MDTRPPKVSIGMPVYNAERYLRESIDSILGQTLVDFELIICDNASTDATGDICLEYAAKDARIRYHRNPENIGAVPNHNLAVALSRGEYFVFGAYDDIRHPDYLQRCVPVLDQDPGLVVCHTRTRYIDGAGRELDMREVELDAAQPLARRRFRELIRMDHMVEPVLGLLRNDVLKRTPVLGVYADSDRVLGAELGLWGRFRLLPEAHFSRRFHAASSASRYPSRQERAAWYDPKKLGRLRFPHFRQFREYVACVWRTPIPASEKIACTGLMLGWLWINRKRLFHDLRWVSGAAASRLVSRFAIHRA